ncbi:hypothetical protein B4U79_17933 [Dinothrombium tinctorium]|uniref:Uncharacterized protein n=1 Tax=Dinothrombium tinctorium TaxID=1965070 RepID=A0A443RHC0_9ACAR|nr:hypothetical protein B4U79_17933 [Dinothrombium tinctorium]
MQIILSFFIMNILIVNSKDNSVLNKICNSLEIKVSTYVHEDANFMNAVLEFSNKNYFRTIKSIKNHFPILNESEFEPDGKLKEATGIQVLNVREIFYHDYLFKANVYYKKDEFDTSTGLLIGFSHVWFGCAQNLCFSPIIDSIIDSSSREIFISNGRLTNYAFRGKYVYDLSRRANSDNAKLVRDMCSKCFQLEYSDSIFVFQDILVRQKDGVIMVLTNRRLFPTKITMHFDDAFVFNNKIYLFDGEYLHMHTIEQNTSQSNAISKFLTAMSMKSRISSVHVHELSSSLPFHIDAAFYHGNTEKIFIFKHWQYVTFTSSQFENPSSSDMSAEFRFPFQDIFHCDNSVYKRVLNNYSYFIENYASNSFPYKKEEESNNHQTLLYLIIYTSGIMLCILVVCIIAVLIFWTENEPKTIHKRGALPKKSTKSKHEDSLKLN